MIVRSAVLLAPLLLALPAGAQARSDAFLDLAGRLPAAWLSDGATPAPLQIHFADHAATTAALAALPAAEPDPAARHGAYARLQTPLVLQGLEAGLDGGWEPLVGFGPFDVATSLVVVAPPEGGATLLRLAPEAAAAVPPALAAAGYAEGARDGVTALARGEDGSSDLAGGNPDDPFSGRMGLPSRVAVEGTLLLQAAGWPAMAALGGDGPKGHPHLPALAAAIDGPDRTGALLQAVLWPEPAAVAPAGGALPPWDLGLLADLADGTSTTTLLLLSYADRAAAEDAAARLAEAWDAAPTTSGRTLRDITGSPAAVEVTGEGPFVVALALRAPADVAQGGWPVNRPFHRLHQGWARGDLALIGAG